MSEIEQLRQHIDRRFDAQEVLLVRQNNMLTGNGDPEKGAMFRLAKLEESKRARDKWIAFALFGSVTAIVSTGWAAFKTKVLGLP